MQQNLYLRKKAKMTKKTKEKIEKVDSAEEVVEEDLVAREKRATKESEIDGHVAPDESFSGQEIALEDVENETGTKEKVAPEVYAINDDNEVAKEASEKTTPKKSKKTKTKVTKSRGHSKKYLEIAEKFERNKKYTLENAVKLVKELSYSKFDGTVDMAIKLEKNKKGDDSIRGTVRLPHGSGKKLKVEVATDEVIEKIKKGWMDFDTLVATAEMMPRLAQVAKILGPKGKMPNPKDGTVVDDVKSAVEDLSGNIVGYRADIGRNIHVPIGKVSWDEAKIIENATVVLKALIHLKKASVTLSPTMGPGIKIDAR